MPHDTEQQQQQQQQQDSPGRCSASEQPEALARAFPKSKLLTNSSACSTPSELTPAQQQALSAIDARLHLLGDYAVEAFKCQLWEPSRAVKELEPGNFGGQSLMLLMSVLGVFTSNPAACMLTSCSNVFSVSLQHCMHIIVLLSVSLSRGMPSRSFTQARL